MAIDIFLRASVRPLGHTVGNTDGLPEAVAFLINQIIAVDKAGLIQAIKNNQEIQLLVASQIQEPAE